MNRQQRLFSLKKICIDNLGANEPEGQNVTCQSAATKIHCHQYIYTALLIMPFGDTMTL